jgi:DNA-binding response OmpR family regulator
MKKLLLIESDPFLALILLKRFRREQFEVRHASHVEEAWRFIAMEQPEAILAGLVLPRKDGFEFLQELRAHPTAGGIRVAVYTRLGSREDVARCSQFDIDAYFIKSHHTPEDVVASLIRTWSDQPIYSS